jgi:DegV family protein with EDD domain
MAAVAFDRQIGAKMSKVAIVTDSNSGISQAEGASLGVFVIPMPFFIQEETYFENVNLTVDEFYEHMAGGADIVTSQPSPDSILRMWNELLESYDEVVQIPMSSGLSGSCETAIMLSGDYNNRVFVVNNQRISVTQRQSVLDALELAKRGKSGAQIRDILESDRHNSTIYIMLDTLYYLKKGGRITPAAAAMGTFLKIKPVLQVHGEKLDAFAKARTTAQGKSIMIKALHNDLHTRLSYDPERKDVWLQIAHTQNLEAALALQKELEEVYPGYDIYMDQLSLSVACHIGPGSLAVACCKKMNYDQM